MKAVIEFINKGVILFTLFMILLLGINLFYTSVVLVEKNIYRNHHQFEAYKDSLDLRILFFGDSLPVHDVNPEYISGSFNLATPGESIEQTYYKVKWAIENTDTKIFVLEYNYHLFNYDRIKPYYDTWYWKNYMSYNELVFVTNDSVANLFLMTKIPIIGKGEEIYKFYTDRREKTVIKNGWFRDDTIFPEDRENTTDVGKTRALNQFKNYPNVRDEKHVQEFIKIIELLEKSGRTFYLVKYPLTDEYLSPLESINISEEYKDIDLRVAKYVLDYRETYRYNNTLFIDSDHLNTRGSEIFSKQLNLDIRKFIKEY